VKLLSLGDVSMLHIGQGRRYMKTIYAICE
jgi:hypothetical protein